MELTVDLIKEKSIPILKKHGVKRASLFGSYVRGEQKPGSDIDLIIEFKEDKSLLDRIGLQLDLQNKLKRRVDVLTFRSIHPLLEKHILKEQKKIM